MENKRHAKRYIETFEVCREVVTNERLLTLEYLNALLSSFAMDSRLAASVAVPAWEIVESNNEILSHGGDVGTAIDQTQDAINALLPAPRREIAEVAASNTRRTDIPYTWQEYIPLPTVGGPEVPLARLAPAPPPPPSPSQFTFSMNPVESRSPVDPLSFASFYKSYTQ
jgi:hypothetical protein